MSYSKVLKNMVADANITQSALSEKCKELNAPISRGQLNKILGGKAPAPEEKVSRTIAKICNCDDKELVLEGYLEKAPKEFIEFLDVLQTTTMNLSLNMYYKKLNEKQKNKLSELFSNETRAKIMLDILEMKQDFEFEVDSIKINTNKKIELKLDELHYMIMEDDSMQDKIPKGSKLKLRLQEKYKNGDIVVVKVKENKEPIIRNVFFIGRDICLYALNKKYDSLFLKNGEYQILCGVSSVEIKL